MHYFRNVGLGWCVGVILLAAASAQNQQTKELTAPVPVQIASSKKIFISNGGTDIQARFSSDEADKSYNEFYTAMKAWGRYQLADTPGEADLIYEIRSIVPFAGVGPELKLSVVDARTHFTLWRLFEPVRVANRRVAWEKNFAAGMASLVDDVKKLSERADAAAGSASK